MIFIVTSNDRPNLNRLTDLNWVYIGSYRGREQITGILKESRRRFIGKDIEYVVDSVRNNFVDYIGKISQQQKDKVIWYSSRMASKSVSQTSMFHQYVYQKLLELLQEKNEDILIVTDDDELLGNVKKIKPEKVEVLSNCIFYKKQICDKIKGYLRVLRYFLLWLICKFLKNKQLREFNVFIHSWIDERVFVKLPEFTDSYLGGLGNFLTDRGCRVGRLGPLRFRLKYILKLKKWFTNIVYPLSYLTFADLIRSIFTKLTITINDNALVYTKDLKILNILAENEMIKENRSKIYLDYLLLFYSYKNLSSIINKNIPIIYPFENQPWEKMLNLSFEKFDRIAYMHSTIPYNWLDYRVSCYEKDAPLPKTIVTPGKKWSSFLKEHYRTSVIKEAGAIRFPHIFDEKLKNKENNQSKRIIVALPLNPTVSISLQKCLLKFLKQNPLLDYTITIKPHPHLPKSLCLESAFVNYKNCKFVKISIEELLRDCILLITSASTAVFEAVFSKIKTLYFIPEEVSWGQEYFVTDYLFIAYEENFLEKLEGALKSPSYPDANIKDYFSPPDYRIFLEYLNLRSVN